MSLTERFLFCLQVIADDVNVHEETKEELLAATNSVQEAALSSMISEIVTHYASLARTVNSHVSLLEKSVEVHELYCNECHRCQEMIVNERQHLQQIRASSRVGIAAVHRQMDLLKVEHWCCFLYCQTLYHTHTSTVLMVILQVSVA